MLILGRTPKQSVDLIAEGILIRVSVESVQIAGRGPKQRATVYLGFDAPANVVILRTELHRG